MNAQVKSIGVSIEDKTIDLMVNLYGGCDKDLEYVICTDTTVENITELCYEYTGLLWLELTNELGGYYTRLSTDEQRQAFTQLFAELDSDPNAKIPKSIPCALRKELGRTLRKMRTLKESPESLLKGALTKTEHGYVLELWFNEERNRIYIGMVEPVFSQAVCQAADETRLQDIEDCESGPVVTLIQPAFKPIIHKTAMPVGVITNSLLGKFIQEGEELTAEEIAEIQRIERIFRGEARD